MDQEEEMMMKRTYQDPAYPGSYGGVDSVYRALEGKVSRRKIKKWLSTQNAYTLHKPARKNFTRGRVMVSGIDAQWQADLIDMSTLKSENDQYRFILSCIDIFSKYAWVVALKKKDGLSIVNAFADIFKERKPKKLQTDQGTEFINKRFQEFLKAEEVYFFTTHSETKACVIERFNRTLKTKMWKYLTSKNTYRYIDVLDKLVYSYNHSYHRSIKMEPINLK